jgi:hypothetical protein
MLHSVNVMGIPREVGAVNCHDQLDAHPYSWLRDGFLNRVRSIPFRMFASPPLIRDIDRPRQSPICAPSLREASDR